MKKIKTWLIIAFSLIFIGGIFFGGIMTMLKWDFTKLSTSKCITNSYDITDEYKNISIKTTNSKKVRVNDRVFSSVKKAAQFIGVWSETLIRCIKNNRKCKGYIVKYDNQQPSIDLNGL